MIFYNVIWIGRRFLDKIENHAYPSVWIKAVFKSAYHTYFNWQVVNFNWRHRLAIILMRYIQVVQQNRTWWGWLHEFLCTSSLEAWSVDGIFYSESSFYTVLREFWSRKSPTRHWRTRKRGRDLRMKIFSCVWRLIVTRSFPKNQSSLEP